MKTRTPTPSATFCPVCAQPNACAVAVGSTPGGCWCMDAAIDTAAIGGVYGNDPRCLCANCARQFKQVANTPDYKADARK